MDGAATYTRSLALGVLLGLAAVAALHILADPYGLLPTPRWDGVNAHKPAAGTRVRTSKPHAVGYAAPRTVIIGNSRPELGLDPDSACWPAQAGPVYNFAVPGSGVYEQFRYAQHAATVAPVERLLVGVDFADFTVPARGAAPAWPPDARPFEDRLVVDADLQPNAGYPLHAVLDLGQALLSLGGAADSVRTLASQGRADGSDRTALGFNPGRDFLPVVHFEGQATLFAQKNDETAARFAGEPLALVHTGGAESEATRSLRALLRFARERGLQVVLFVNPYHADYLETIRQAGLWPLFAEWKTSMAAIAREHDVPLWDFALVHPATTESPPPAGDRRTVLQWFWEPGHYRRELGEAMLARMLGTGCANPLPDFGARVDPAMLTPHLAAQAEAIERQSSRDPAMRDRIAAAIARVRD